MSVHRRLTWSSYLRRRFGAPVRKLPLDVAPEGAGCPNREPGGGGPCVFCNPAGSGTGLAARGVSLEEQWARMLAGRRGRGREALPWAYLQAYSATYGDVGRLEALLARVRELPGIAGLAVGTRPDCLDAAKLALLAAQPYEEVWLELGLQSASDATLARIGRGHDAASFARACVAAHKAGLKVCAHVVLGLPGEGPEEMRATAEFLAGLPPLAVAGVKLHTCWVARGARLERIWRRGAYTPPSLAQAAAWCVDVLERCPATAVVQRLMGDPAPGELLAPAWAADKPAALDAVARELERRETWQGRMADAPEAPPEWFDPAAPLPEILCNHLRSI